MNIGPWFNGLPISIQILVVCVWGLTSLCAAITALLRQWERVQRVREESPAEQGPEE